MPFKQAKVAITNYSNNGEFDFEEYYDMYLFYGN